MTYTLSDIAPDWLHKARATIIRDQSVLRIGPRNTVEMLGEHSGNFHRLMFGQPEAAIGFSTAEDCQAAYEMLIGERELPEIPIKEE